MQIDHPGDQAQCRHENCNCSVPAGEEYCSDQCRSAATKQPPGTGQRGSCACGHAECKANEPLPAS